MLVASLRGRARSLLGARLLASLPLNAAGVPDELPPPPAAPSPKPGSAADLLQFLQSCHPSWPSSSKIKGRSPRRRRRASEADEATEGEPGPAVPEERKLTKKVLVLFNRAEKKLSKDSMPLDEKLELVKSTLAELRRLSEEDLSPVNLAVIMHRAARLADHPALKAADGAVRTSSQGSLAHVTFIAGLLEKAVALVREKGQEADAAEAAAGGLGNISDRSLPAESRAWVPSAEEVGLATTALFAASLVGVRVSEEDVDALAMALVRGRQRWESRHVVMALVALGRLGAIPLEGQLHYLLTEESAALLDQLTPPEVGTVIRGMALSGYNPGDHFIHNALVALQPSIPELPLGDTMQVLFALGRFPYAPQLGLPAAVPRHHKQEAHAATPLPPLPAPDSGKMALGDEVQKELDGFLGELDGGSGSSGGGLGSDEGDADVGQYHRIEFRGLREMQLMAELSGSSRRYLLGGDASVDANVGGDGSLRTGMRYTYEVQAQPQYDFSSLVGAASRRREERGEAARLAREAEAILRIFRGRVAAAASNSPSPSATATRGSSTGGRTLKERSKSSTKEVDVDGLVHKLLTGDWLSADAESGSEGRKQQRILRLDRLLAEAKVNPKSGRTTIMPHYDASLLWGGSEYEKALFSVPEVTFPLDLDALRGEVDDAEDDAAPSGAPTELDPWMAPGIAAPVAPSELPEGVPPDAAEVAAAVIGALARRALELIPDRSSDITLRLPRHMAVLRHWDAGLLRDIAAQARKENITSTTRPNVLVEFLWAYAVLGEPLPPSLTRDVTSYLLTLRCELGQRLPVDFARLAWSLAALDALDADTFRAICQVVQPAVITTPNGVKLPNKSVEASRTFLIQLYQAALHLQASKGVDGTALLPPAIRGPAAAAWKRRANALRTSATQRHVADVLRMLGVKCELEYEPPGSNVIIDIAVTSPQGERLAVEVDGPSHFASNVHDKFLGSIRLRNNLLKHSGWPVVSVPFYDWGALRSLDEEKEYLKRHVLSRFGQAPLLGKSEAVQQVQSVRRGRQRGRRRRQ